MIEFQYNRHGFNCHSDRDAMTDRWLLGSQLIRTTAQSSLKNEEDKKKTYVCTCYGNEGCMTLNESGDML